MANKIEQKSLAVFIVVIILVFQFQGDHSRHYLCGLLVKLSFWPLRHHGRYQGNCGETGHHHITVVATSASFYRLRDVNNVFVIHNSISTLKDDLGNYCPTLKSSRSGGAWLLVFWRSLRQKILLFPKFFKILTTDESAFSEILHQIESATGSFKKQLQARRPLFVQITTNYASSIKAITVNTLKMIFVFWSCHQRPFTSSWSNVASKYFIF
jgi:hypothetical protein